MPSAQPLVTPAIGKGAPLLTVQDLKVYFEVGGNRLLGFLRTEVRNFGELRARGGVVHREAGLALDPLAVD